MVCCLLISHLTFILIDTDLRSVIRLVRFASTRSMLYHGVLSRIGIRNVFVVRVCYMDPVVRY